MSRCAWKLRCLKEDVETIPGEVPFVAVTETWLKPYVEDSQITVNWEGYRVHRCDRNHRTGGGVMLLTHYKLPVEDHLAVDKDTCQLLMCSSPPSKWTLGVLYRSPSATVEDFKTCLEAARSYLNDRQDYTHCLMGDFNVPETEWDPPMANPRTANSDALMGFAEDALLSQLIDVPSRGDNYLDLMFSNVDSLVSRVSARDTRMSDHRLIEFGLTRDPCSVARETVPPRFAADEFRSLDIRKANIEEICEELSKVDWEDVFSSCTTDELPRVFRDILFQAAQMHCPRKKPRRGPPKLVRKLSRKKRAVQERLTRLKGESKTPAEQIKALEQRLNTLYYQIRDAILHDRDRQESLAVAKIKENAKYFYSYAKRFAGDTGGISALTGEEGELYTEKAEIAELLARQFQAVFSRPEDADLSAADAILVPAAVGPAESDVTFSRKDILDAIKEIDADSAAGPDGIPAYLLKKCAEAVSNPLFLMWRRSLEEGQVPTSTKESLITPLFKKGNRSAAENYRPVSLTDHAIKIFERVVRKKLVEHFEQHELFNPMQHGFLKGKSCLTQLLDHFDEVLNNWMLGKDVDSIYLDYSKAFDRVDHAILIKKLRKYKVHEGLVRWIQSFLEGRTQRVSVDGCLSGPATVRSGVPQGTVLGPILFLVYINDITSVVKGSTLRSFADDTRLLKSIGGIEDMQTLQDDLGSVAQWSARNNMKLHADKFEFLIHGVSREPLLAELPFYQDCKTYTTEAGTLESKPALRDLGVLVTETLDWSRHISKIADNGRRKAAWVLSVFHTRDKGVMITLYKSMVRSLLEYCCPLWNPTKIGDIQLLEGVQRAFTKRISGCENMNYYQRLQHLGLSSLQRHKGKILHTSYVENPARSGPQQPRDQVQYRRTIGNQSRIAKSGKGVTKIKANSV